jgi:phosphoglycolate phosphatase-like HAD superfamily hydrolase
MNINLEEAKFAGFDVDGTIIDNFEVEEKGYIFAFKELFGHSLSEDQYSQVKDMKFDEGLPLLFGVLGLDCNLDNELLREFINQRRFFIEQNIDLTKPVLGIRDVLEKLRDQGTHLAVVSNGYSKNIELALQNLGLYQYFGAFYSNDDGPTFERKPSPAGLISVQDELIRQVSDRKLILEGKSLYFGNNKRDGEAVQALNRLRKEQGYNSNMKFVGVDLRDPLRENPDKAIQRLVTKYYIRSFTDILNPGFALTPYL